MRKIKISFKYQNYADVFDKINANKLSKQRSYDYAIKTKNKIFYYFLSNLFTFCLLLSLKFKKKYLNDNLKRKFIVFFSSLTETLILFVKKTTICNYA